MAQDIKKVNGVYMGSQEIASTLLANYADLEVYYKLEDVVDSSGNGRTLTNNGTTTFAAAKFTNGADLGASNSTKYLSIADNLGINYGGEQSVVFWIKLSTEIGSGAYQFLDRRNSNTSGIQQIQYQYNGGTRRLCWERYNDKNGDNPKFYYNLTMGTTDWYHIAYVYNGTTMYGYVNGIQVGSIASTAYDGLGTGVYSDGFAIGSWVGGANYTSGIFDDYAVFSRSLTSDEIYSLYKTGVKKLSGQVNLNPELESTSLRGDANLVQYTRFEGNSTATVGNNGTDTNITYGTSYGKHGQGALFNGTSSKVALSKTGASVFSVSIWAKLSTVNNNSYIFTVRNTSNNANYGISTTTGNVLQINSYNGSTAGQLASTFIPQTDTWYHIVANINGTSSSLYVNGNLIASGGTIQTHTSGTDVFLGANSAESYMSGSLDDFSIFSRVLTATEISNLYNTNIKKYNGVSNI